MQNKITQLIKESDQILFAILNTCLEPYLFKVINLTFQNGSCIPLPSITIKRNQMGENVEISISDHPLKQYSMGLSRLPTTSKDLFKNR